MPLPRPFFAVVAASAFAAFALSSPSAHAQKKTPVSGAAKKPATVVAAKPEPTTLSAGEKAAIERVSVDTIKQVVTDLTAPEMEGRGTGQPGGDKAAQYIAQRFQSLGLKPLGDKGTFLQTIPFEATEYTPETKFTLDDKTELTLGKDFARVPIPGVGPESSAAGEVVFVGYGVESNPLDHHDLKNIDLQGKIVVLIGSGRPKNFSESSWKQAGDPQAVIIPLIMRQVKAILFVGVESGGLDFPQLADYLSRRQVSLSGAESEGAPPFPLPAFLFIGDEGAEKLFAGSGTTYAELKQKAEANEFVSRPLARSATIAIKATKEKVFSSNVVGVLEGSDPKLKKEAIVISAHYDAYGIDAKTGRVFPGAADNALGIGEMIAIAEALTKAPQKPRRSFVFLAVTGEEFGLLGSKYWIQRPTWPLASVVANLNYDGIGTEVYGPVKSIVGYGKEFSTLGRTLTGAVASLGVVIVPDPMPEEKTFERSDHYTFVQVGIPAMMTLGGPEITDKAAFIARIKKWMKEDYHQPTDIIRPDWDWGGAQTVARLLLVMGMRVSQAEAAPRWLPSSPYQRKATGKPMPVMKKPAPKL